MDTGQNKCQGQVRDRMMVMTGVWVRIIDRVLVRKKARFMARVSDRMLVRSIVRAE